MGWLPTRQKGTSGMTAIGLVEARLALAIDAAELGSWTWDIASETTTWDERLEVMHGIAPGTFGGTFDDWLASMHPADRGPSVARVQAALADPGPYVLLHRVTWPDGSLHTIECRGTVLVDDDGRPTGTTGVAIDVTAREQLVQTLQQSLLPSSLPHHSGTRVAARYRTATAQPEIGGDWYAVIALPDRKMGLAIGDVAGHGLGAIADMAAARFSLRALALTDPEPAAVLAKLDRVVEVFESDAMITALYGVFDLDDRTWTWASAGHVPAVVRNADRTTVVLDEPNDPPLGIARSFRTHCTRIAEGATLFLYTDGLVERRGESIDAGIRRVADACAAAPADPELLCDQVTDALLGPTPHDDDVAMLAASFDCPERG